MRDRQETGALIKLAGAMGVLMLLFTVVEAFFLYHSEEISALDWNDRRIAASRR